MCECYKIGGPWIAEDPDCPVHGYAAQREREIQEQDRESLEDRIRALEEMVEHQGRLIRELTALVIKPVYPSAE
jgi:hypothetical protein